MTPMYLPPRRDDDGERVDFLRSLNILDSGADEAFDRITREASSIMQTPIALVSLVDQDRQWFKSKVGLDANETPRNLAFCAHAIYPDNPGLFVVNDAQQDERFQFHDLVLNDPRIRFYAGAPLVSSSVDGVSWNLGTLCIIDMQPRSLREEHAKHLEILARQVVSEIERHARETTTCMLLEQPMSICTSSPELCTNDAMEEFSLGPGLSQQ